MAGGANGHGPGVTLLIVLLLILLVAAGLLGFVLEVAAWLFVGFLVVAAVLAFLVWRWWSNTVDRVGNRVHGDRRT
jgi:membrane protein implicated in regulation of membrane protease activity